MNFCLVVLLNFFSALPLNNERDSLIEIRNLYEESASSKESLEKLFRLLKETKKDNALIKGYTGAALMIEANHLLNPLNKWNRFKTGKGLIEQAVSAEPQNLEMRYIRLTIQTNLPVFLGYNSNIQSDKQVIVSRLPDLDDADLANRIAAYLLSAGICSSREITTIKSWTSR